MISFLDAIGQAFHDFWVEVLGLTEKVFTSVWELIKDFFLWVLDQVLSLVTILLSAIDLSSITQYLPVFDQIPDEVLNVLGLLGFAQCMAILSGAIIIRIGLQLIPFVRLGS